MHTQADPSAVGWGGSIRRVTPLRWLRETSSRQVPDWMRNGGVVGVFAVLIFFRLVLGYGWLETVAVGVIVGVSLASLAKIIWAAANPLAPYDDPTDGERLRED